MIDDIKTQRGDSKFIIDVLYGVASSLSWYGHMCTSKVNVTRIRGPIIILLRFNCERLEWG